MENKTDDLLKEMQKWLDKACFSHFFKVAHSFLNKYPAYPELRDEVERLGSNYDLLFNCYKSGVVDPKRNEILHGLIDSVLRLYHNLRLVETIETYSFLQVAKKRAAQVDLLQVAEMFPGKKGDLEWYNAVFSAILISWQWDEKKADYFCNLLTDAETDPVFVRLMISAIMLSGNCEFDAAKTKCLVNVCISAQNALVRQYAEVALVFSAASCEKTDSLIYVYQAIKPLVMVPELCVELQELQKQIIICMDAEKDSVQVDKELISSLPVSRMPKFMKNDELEDTPIDEILHPEDEEDASEKLEASVRKMLAMQQAGSDIYYNGFSKMKNFPFFRRLSNWFLPFYAENPSLAPLVNALDGDTRMLKSLAASYTFCQSDKYSFAFAVETSLKHELAKLKSFIKEGMMFGGEADVMDVNQAMFVRRMYLQDLFRFFNVSPFKEAFCNPFDKKQQTGGLFLKSWSIPYGDELKPALVNVCRFLYKRKNLKVLALFSAVVGIEKEEDNELLWYFIQALVHTEQYDKALGLIPFLSEKYQQTVQCVRLKAKCELLTEEFDKALQDYSKVQELKPSLSNQIKIAYCNLMQGEVEDAMSLLFELDYKHPNHPDIMRSLAWGHLQRQNVDAAIALYQKLQQMYKMDSSEFDPEDIYNEGLCNWFQKDVKKASVAFHEYMEIAGINMDDFEEKLDDDEELLDKYDIGHWDISLMMDSIQVEN